MNNRYILEIEHALSQPRLEQYRPRNGSDQDMLENYLWNIQLSQALVPVLHAAELALRNTIHTTLTDHFDTDQWFYIPDLLEPQQLATFATARSRTIQKHKDAAAIGHVIAELNFGFWVWVLSGKHEQRIWQPNGFALMQAAFPYAGAVSHQHIHQRFDSIRQLRNRIFHFEAIWHYSNLDRRHAETAEAVRWISPALGSAIAAIDQFGAVLTARARFGDRSNVDPLGLAS